MIKRKEPLILFFFGIVFFFLYNLDKSFFFKIQGIHSWRQADCLSMVYNYYTNGLNFFDSSFLCVNSATCNGKVVGEFPILYYITALLWKVFGQHEFILKLLNFSLFLMGLIYLYKLCGKIFPNTPIKAVPLLLIIGSPVIVYYCNNYIPDIPALGLVMAGFYYYYVFLQDPEKNTLIKPSVFWLFAMLLKVTAGILPMAAIAVFLIEGLRNKKTLIYIKKCVPFFITTIVVGVWYYYANWYNEKNQSHHFLLTGLMPIWKVRPEVLPLKTEIIFSKTITLLFPKFMHILVLCLYGFLLVNFRRLSKPLLNLTAICFVGTLVYFMFWYDQFEVHDYYFINFIPFYTCVFLLFGNYYLSIKTKLARRIVTALCYLVVLLNVYNASVDIRLRYYYDDDILRFSLEDKKDIEMSKYLDYLYQAYIKPFETCKPYLKQIGVDPKERAIILPDYTYNETLYLTGMRGFTASGRVGIDGDSYVFDEATIKGQIACGAKYLIIYNEKLLENEGLKKYMTHPIGRYKKIYIFALK